MITDFHPGETLRLVSVEERYSVYEGRDGSVYLEHGTGRRLAGFGDLDLERLWREWMMLRAPGVFNDWLLRYTWEDDAVAEVRSCSYCGQPKHSDDMTSVHGGLVCDTGCVDNYWQCVHCLDLFTETTTVNEQEVCNFCLSDYYSWCEDCDVYYDTDSGEDHRHGDGCCESPAPTFSIRNDGKPPLPNDETTGVHLGAGVISSEGVEEIGAVLRHHGWQMMQDLEPDPQERRIEAARIRREWECLSWRLGELGGQWQTRDGNYTKRLSKMAYKAGLKIPPEVLSKIGNIGRDHSQGTDLTVEVTRMLNDSPDQFANEDSCWWGSEYASRCALKTNGGFGLRSVDRNGWVSGRVWVLPLKREASGHLTPTFETLDPVAYVAFNGYEDLEGYTGARVLAQMTGWTYRKIEFSCRPMWINSGSGYLVAPEEVAAPYTDGSLSLYLDQHSSLFADEQANEREMSHV